MSNQCALPPTLRATIHGLLLPHVAAGAQTLVAPSSSTALPSTDTKPKPKAKRGGRQGKRSASPFECGAAPADDAVSEATPSTTGNAGPTNAHPGLNGDWRAGFEDLPTIDSAGRPVDRERLVALLNVAVPDALHTLLKHDAPRTTPFASDGVFVVAEEACAALRQWEIATMGMGMPPSMLKAMDTADITVAQAIDLISNVTAAVRQYVDDRVARMATPPRALLLAQRLGLTRKETRALVQVLVMHCATSSTVSPTTALAPSNIARAVHMSSEELVEFLREQRAHVKQGVLTMSETGLNFKSFGETRLRMSVEVITALCGGTLSEEQLIKLERTALCDVMRDVASAAVGMPPPTRLPPRAEDVSSGRPKNGHHGENAASKRFPASGRKGDDGRQSGGSNSNNRNHLSDSHPHNDGSDSGDSDDDDEERLGRQSTTGSAVGSPTWNAAASADKLTQPYTADLEYMDDYFKWLATLVKLRNAETDVKDDEDDYYNPKNKAEATLRELKGRERVLSNALASRIEVTRVRGSWKPRAEILCDRLELSATEKKILLLLIGNVVSHDVLIAVNGRYVMRGDGQREFTVGYVLFVLFGNLEQRVHGRRCFYQSAPLVRHGLVSVSAPTTSRNAFNTDLSDYMLDVDRRIVDHLMGLDTEPTEMVQGSKVYAPTVPLEQVVLPRHTTDAVLTTIKHYALLSACKRKCGFGEAVGDAAGATGGLVLLFYGPSGTGKTMLANAVAKDLGKKVLLVNAQHFKQLSATQGSDTMRFIFREAKLSDAIVFFDECETIFESRDSNPLLTSILPEFERHDGIVVLATNRAQTIDEAMNRRISLMVEFTLPDHEMRERIWRAHIPVQLKLADDVSVETVALDYELSGGLIKNAMLAALSNAVARENTDTPTLTMSDLAHGAKTQMRGLFQAADSTLTKKNQSAYVVPRRRLEDVVLPDEARRALREIVKLTKSRHTLYAQWGFDQHDGDRENAIVLLHGASGTGKMLCAEAIAFECGLSLRVANTSALMYAGDSAGDIQKVFEEARVMNAAVAFDEAQVLFEHNERAKQVAQQIQFHAAVFTKPVLVIAQTERGAAADMRACQMRFTDDIAFSLPSRPLRKRLWEAFLPDKVPRVAEGIDFDALANANGVSARLIKAVCFGCCAKAALRPAEARRVSTEDLLAELRLHQELEQRRAAPTSMFV